MYADRFAKDEKLLRSKRSCSYPQVLFVSLFCLKKLLNMAVVRNFRVKLG
jgi:hypothetical protein